MSLFLNPGEQEKMILQNYRLVYFIIKKLNIAQDQYEDIVSIGTIGLIKAVNTFDFERNIRFSTYAGRCIENEILMYMRKEKKHNADISLDETITTNVDGNTLKVGDLISISRDFTEDIMISEIVLKCISIILNRLTEKERLFCKIVRDADKLDIFFEAETMFWKDDIDRINVEKCAITDEIMEPILNKETIKIKKGDNELVRLLSMIAFVFDINFKPSLSIIKNKKYIDSILNRFEFKDENTKKQIEVIKENINNYIDERLKK